MYYNVLFIYQAENKESEGEEMAVDIVFPLLNVSF